MPWYRLTASYAIGHPKIGLVEPGEIFFVPWRYDDNPHREEVPAPANAAGLKTHGYTPPSDQPTPSSAPGGAPDTPLAWGAFKAKHTTHAAARDAFIEATGVTPQWGWEGLKMAYCDHYGER